MKKAHIISISIIVASILAMSMIDGLKTDLRVQVMEINGVYMRCVDTYPNKPEFYTCRTRDGVKLYQFITIKTYKPATLFVIKVLFVVLVIMAVLIYIDRYKPDFWLFKPHEE